MSDREKVINDLQDAVNDDWMWQHANYYAKAMKNAIALLKEQEAVKRTSRKGTNGFSIVWTCGACGSDLHPNNAKAKYCSNCGQAVKWDG